MPRFDPPGLDAYLEEEKAQTNIRGKEIIDRIEKTLQKVIIDELKREMPEGDDWWTLGVPQAVRLKVSQKHEQDDRQRGGLEYYFDLIEYSKIALHNWELFQPILGYGTGGRDKQLSWMNFVNIKRNIVSHPSSAKTLTLDEISQLEEYERWLDERLADLAVAEPQASSAAVT